MILRGPDGTIPSSASETLSSFLRSHAELFSVDFRLGRGGITRAGRRVRRKNVRHLLKGSAVDGGTPDIFFKVPDSCGAGNRGDMIAPAERPRRWLSALIYRNGVIEESGVAAAVLNHPANGVAWLANKLAPYGQRLEAGEIILGGSFTAPVPARTGDNFHVDYGPLGSISARFV